MKRAGEKSAESVDVTFLTPVHPGRSRWLAATAKSVQGAIVALSGQEISCEWVVVLDGPGQIDRPDNTRILQTTNRNGPAIARTFGACAANGEWIFPIDADDLVVAGGVRACLDRAIKRPELGWIGCSRTLVDGTPTAHTVSKEARFAAGELAENWMSPFEFHPNSVLLRTSALLASGGWPAVSVCEDLAAVLLVSELSSGYVVADVATRYRIWDQQIVGELGYPEAKNQAFLTIENLVSARRVACGRTPVSAPTPGPAQRGGWK